MSGGESVDRLREAAADHVTVEGQRVPVVIDPELVPRGMTDWYPLTIRLREYDRGVLLHEVLHVALHSGPTGERIPPDSHLHEPTVWRCTRAVAAFLGWDLPPVGHEPESPRTAVVLDLDDPIFDGQTLPDALRDYEHVHSTTGVCVKNVAGPFCAQPASPPATTAAAEGSSDTSGRSVPDSLPQCGACDGRGVVVGCRRCGGTGLAASPLATDGDAAACCCEQITARLLVCPAHPGQVVMRPVDEASDTWDAAPQDTETGTL